MAVKDTLDKIVERHPDVIGAMVMHNGKIQHNLESPYDILSVDAMLETFEEIFEQTSILEDEGYDFGELMLDFANHSFIVRSIDGGLLAVLAPQMQRGQLVKLHVGLGIFGKAVQKAIEDEAAAPAPAAEPIVAAEPPVAKAPPVVKYDATEPVQALEPVAESPQVDEPQAEESGLGAMLGLGKKRRGGFRGTKELLASRVAAAEAEDAITAPTPKDAAQQAGGEEVPLRPDGTPMKKKFYRGSVYWE